MHPRPRVADMVALGAGAALPLAFSPFDFFPLAFLAPALLFHLWLEGSPARAAWRGFLFGLGMFGVGVSWVYISLHNFGHMPVPLAALATFLFVVVLALYPALLGFIQARWLDAQGRANAASAGRAGAADRQRPTHALLVLPALWVLFEWIRSWFLSGFPWLNLGYSQSDTWLVGVASWFGVYGVSLLVAIVSGLLVQSLRAPEKFLRHYLPALLAIFISGWLAGKMEWTEPVGAPLSVALVQGNVPLELKWQPAYRNTVLERYRSLSDQAGDAKLIVWPEAAIPARLDEIDPNYLAELKRQNSDFLIGVVERDQTTRQYYNSVVSLGRGTGLYRKQHLVPFGEFLPFPVLFRWLLDSLHIPMSDFSHGTADQPPLTAAGHKIGVSVCYEDAFGEEIIRSLPQATLLVNVSEDAWFGDSLAPHQRLQIARLRALEAGRPMLRAANTGPSAAIDHYGRVVARSPQFEVAVLHIVVQPRQGLTPYARMGNTPVVLMLLLLMGWGIYRRWR